MNLIEAETFEQIVEGFYDGDHRFTLSASGSIRIGRGFTRVLRADVRWTCDHANDVIKGRLAKRILREFHRAGNLDGVVKWAEVCDQVNSGCPVMRGNKS